MTDFIGNRIDTIIHYYRISQKDFSNKINESDRNISNAVNGKNLPNIKIIEKICKAFPELNARWLLTGEGEMFDEVAKSAHGDTLDSRDVEIAHLKKRVGDLEKIIGLLERERK